VTYQMGILWILLVIYYEQHMRYFYIFCEYIFYVFAVSKIILFFWARRIHKSLELGLELKKMNLRILDEIQQFFNIDIKIWNRCKFFTNLGILTWGIWKSSEGRPFYKQIKQFTRVVWCWRNLVRDTIPFSSISK